MKKLIILLFLFTSCHNTIFSDVVIIKAEKLEPDHSYDYRYTIEGDVYDPILYSNNVYSVGDTLN